ncbi:hypothetical protein EVAR_91421_1 [Eumeta japonica]|uniref:Uncharacterized protein n=1 Tax=Eumeta variegata TaxID=151549 RepID=A0A4C1X338_EUMVA|nr:hypothetical protein EVAR_91421_1 [Eumeta japonica]
MGGRRRRSDAIVINETQEPTIGRNVPVVDPPIAGPASVGGPRPPPARPRPTYSPAFANYHSLCRRTGS